MRAAVMRGTELHVEDVPDPVPGEGQMLVRTVACGICGSDLHALKHFDEMLETMPSLTGGSDRPDPAAGIVMGHEFCAEVLELGPGATGVSVGDLVVSIPAVLTANGPEAIGYSNTYPGGYGELMLLQFPMKVPEGLDARRAALTEPLAVGVHAVNRSSIAPGEAALVLGCGPIGLACIAALKLKGIEPIVAADFSSKRREVASAMGAHLVVDPRTEPAIEAWRRVDGSKSLVIFEAIGVPGVIDQAFRDAPARTRVVVVGVCMTEDHFRPSVAVVKELDVRFCLGYDPMEFGDTLRAIAEGTIDVDPMITGSVDVDGVPKAFTDLASPDEHVKILVEP